MWFSSYTFFEETYLFNKTTLQKNKLTSLKNKLKLFYDKFYELWQNFLLWKINRLCNISVYVHKLSLNIRKDLLTLQWTFMFETMKSIQKFTGNTSTVYWIFQYNHLKLQLYFIIKRTEEFYFYESVNKIDMYNFTVSSSVNMHFKSICEFTEDW